jgi:hypothetical protein
MHWSTCKNCKIIIQHENEAVKFNIRRRKVDTKDLSYEICHKCYDEIISKFPIFNVEHPKQNSTEKIIKEKINDTILDVVLYSKYQSDNENYLVPECYDELTDNIWKIIKKYCHIK